MKDIRIDVGVCTSLSINLADVDWTGIKKVIFTVKNSASYKAAAIIEREFTEAKVHEVIIKPEESIQLIDSAVYDFNSVLTNGTRQKMTDNGKVVLRKGVGDCVDDH
jgi:hypothetical protein